MAVARPRAGRDYPRDWNEFLKLFTSEQDCFDYLERVRWGKSFYCPHCATINGPFWRMGDGRRRCKLCRRESTVTAGTIFHGTRYDLRIWVRGDLARRQREERGQRADAAAKSRLSQLRDGLGLAAQVAPRDGST